MIFFSRKTSRIDHSSLVVGFFAGLGGQGEGDRVAVRFTQDDFLLINNVGSINKLSNIEANIVDFVSAGNCGDNDVLDDTGLDGFGVGQLKSNIEGFGDKGNFVSLGLVFLTAVLVFTSTVVIAITGGFAAGDLHGLRFIGISHLGDGSGQVRDKRGIAVGAEFVLLNGISGGTDSYDLVITIVSILNDLNGQFDGGNLGGESGHTDLSVDRGVGIPAVVLGAVAVCGGMVGKSHQRQQSQDKGLKYFEKLI
jgi:hypothetical protein